MKNLVLASLLALAVLPEGMGAAEALAQEKKRPEPIVSAMALSHGPRPVLALGMGNGVIRVLYAEDTTEIQAHPHKTANEAAVHALAFAAHGKVLASIGYERAVRLWDPQTGHAIGVLQSRFMGDRLAFSPDSSKLAIQDDAGGLEVFDLKQQTNRNWKLNVGTSGPLWLADNRHVVATSDTDGVLIIETTTGHVDKLSPSGRVKAMALSPDRRILAIAQASDQPGKESQVALWNLETKKRLRTLEHNVPTDALAFSPSGQRLACGGAHGTVVVWELGQEPKPTAVWITDIRQIADLAFVGEETLAARSKDSRFRGTSITDLPQLGETLPEGLPEETPLPPAAPRRVKPAKPARPLADTM